MKNKRYEKGITLVALIITIIVLLILAMVSIATVSDTGIIKHAKQSVKEHIIGEEKEKITLAYSSYKLAQYTSDDAKLEIDGATVTGIDDFGYNVQFNETGNYYSVDPNGNVEYLEKVEVPEATLTGNYKYDSRIVGDYNIYGFIHHEIIAEDKNLNGLTTPQIPAKLTYKDGTKEEIIFYYTGKVGDGQQSYDENDKTAYWEYYVEGTPTLGEDGIYTYTGDSSKGRMSLQSYSSSMGDGTITYSDENNHLLWIHDGYDTDWENKLIDLVKIEILGKEINNVTSYLLYANVEKSDIDLIKNVNNIKRVITSFKDAPQKVGTEFMYLDEFTFAAGDENDKIVCLYMINEDVDEATGKTYQGEMLIYSPNKTVDSITFEEEIDGELVMTTVKLEPYVEQ